MRDNSHNNNTPEEQPLIASPSPKRKSVVSGRMNNEDEEAGATTTTTTSSSSLDREHLPSGGSLRRGSGGVFDLSLNNDTDLYSVLPEVEAAREGGGGLETSPTEVEELSSFLRKNVRLPSNWRQRLFLNALPLTKWLPNYKVREYIFADLLAGVTCGILSVPQGLAYAQLANLYIHFSPSSLPSISTMHQLLSYIFWYLSFSPSLHLSIPLLFLLIDSFPHPLQLISSRPPNYGLFSACFPPIIYFFFGSSPHLIIGPTAVMSMLVGSLNLNPQNIFLASFLVGIIQLLAGIFQIGFFANLLSHAVIVGFTTAAALIISCSQLKYIFNAPIPTTNVWAGLKGMTQLIHDGEVHWWCFLLSTMAIVFLLTLRAVKRVPRWFPGGLLMVVVGTLLSYLLDLESHGISNVPAFSGGLIAPHSFSFENTVQLLPSCFLMALIGFIEAVSVGKTFAIQHNYDLGANEELYGLGWCNIVGAFFSSFPSTGSFARTAVNANTGGKTGISNLVSAIFVMQVMLFATPLFRYLPNGILGAVVVVAAVGLVDTASISFMWKSKKSDFFIALCSFALTIGLGIEMGIGSAFALSIAFCVLQRFVIRRFASSPSCCHPRTPTSSPHFLCSVRPTDQVIFFPSSTPLIKRADILESSPYATPVHESIFVWRMFDTLYFANKNFCKTRITELLSPATSTETLLSTAGELIDYPVRFFVIDAISMNSIDTDGLHALHEICDYLKKRKTTLLIARLSREPYRTIQRSGLLSDIGKDHFFKEIHEAIAFASQVGFQTSPPFPTYILVLLTYSYTCLERTVRYGASESQIITEPSSFEEELRKHESRTLFESKPQL
jgi:SulP family sulfate permease